MLSGYFYSHYNFNPRSPHGERPIPVWHKSRGKDISIHAPRTGSDAAARSTFAQSRAFQSTLPARGATHHKRFRQVAKNISIHAPRTGSDMGVMRVKPKPCPFQSTLPARGATGCCERKQNKHPCISIHAPRTGSDARACVSDAALVHFNPRSPHGERQARKSA